MGIHGRWVIHGYMSVHTDIHECAWIDVDVRGYTDIHGYA